MLRLMIVEVMVGMVVLCGCGKKTVTVPTPDGKMTIDKESGQTTMTIQGDNGQQTTVTAGQKVTIPKDFPSDIPIYSGATPTAVASMPDGQNVSLEIKDPAAKVFQYYQNELPKKGWKVQATVNTAGGSMVTATKEKQQVIVNVITDNGKTIVNLTVSRG